LFSTRNAQSGGNIAVRCVRGSAHKGTAGQGFRAGWGMKDETTAFGGFFVFF